MVYCECGTTNKKQGEYLEAGGEGGDSALTAPSLNRHPHTRAHTTLQTGQEEEGGGMIASY